MSKLSQELNQTPMISTDIQVDIERLIRQIGFLRCCIKCGETLGPNEEEEILSLIKELRNKY